MQADEDERLYCRDTTGFGPMPPWGKFFLQLGKSLASIEPGPDGLRVAVAVPIRAFAAPLIAAGYILGNLSASASVADRDTGGFGHLSGVEVGTRVFLREGNMLLEGKYIGFGTPLPGATCAGVELHSTSRRWLPSAEAHRILVPKVQAASGDDVSGRQWRLIRRSATYRFMRALLPEDHVTTLLTRAVLACVLVGPAATLREELQGKWFAVEPNMPPAEPRATPQAPIPGSLQDIVRAKRLLASPGPYHSDIVPAASRGRGVPASLTKSRLLIFDGAVGYLRWHSELGHKGIVVVLDRTERRMSDAAHVVDTEFLSRSGDLELKISQMQPAGTEVIGYWERR